MRNDQNRMGRARQRVKEKEIRQKIMKNVKIKEKHKLMILCCHHSYLMLSILIIRFFCVCAPGGG